MTTSAEDIKVLNKNQQTLNERLTQLNNNVQESVNHFNGRSEEVISRLSALEQVAANEGGRSFGGPAANFSIGQIVAQDNQLNDLRDGKVQKVIIPSDQSIKQLRAAIVGDDSSSHSNYPIQPDRAAGIYNDPRRALRILDLIQRLPVTSNSFEFVSLDSFVNAADYQAEEGALKASQDVQSALNSRPIHTIAVTTEASEQVLSDEPQLVTFLNSKLTYGVLEKLEAEIISGSGSGTISGLLTEATTFTPSSSAMGADSIGEALAELEVTGWSGGAIIMHPRKWQSMRSERDTDGGYVMGSPANPIGPTLWGVPVVTSATISEDTAVVMDPTQVALLDRMAPRFQIGVVDDQFARNLLTLRAELRAGLAVFAPSAVLKFTV